LPSFFQTSPSKGRDGTGDGQVLATWKQSIVLSAKNATEHWYTESTGSSGPTKMKEASGQGSIIG
jgi:hypothetical protein